MLERTVEAFNAGNDIMLWPQWQPANPTQADYDRMQLTSKKMLHEWDQLFVQELHFPLWSAAP